MPLVIISIQNVVRTRNTVFYIKKIIFFFFNFETQILNKQLLDLDIYLIQIIKYLPFRCTYYIRLDVLQNVENVPWIYRGLYDVLMLQWQTKLIAALV